jgi:hypothetical protein
MQGKTKEEIKKEIKIITLLFFPLDGGKWPVSPLLCV